MGIINQETYVKSRIIRNVVNSLYFINYFILAFFLLIIPIQLAFFQSIKNYDQRLQDYFDYIITIIFLIHIALYVDNWIINKAAILLKSNKNTFQHYIYSFISLQIIYDVVTFLVSAIVISKQGKSYIQRIIELIFILKLYKLWVFDEKITYLIIASPYYVVFRIFRALLVIVTTCFYFGSVFYGVAQLIYLYDNEQVYYYLNWLYVLGLANETFLTQFQMTLYWALSTSSTAAYGDICAIDPLGIIVNIVALVFEGFLWGYYMSTIHSIPQQLKKQQNTLQEQFKAFRKSCSEFTLNQKLQLQILCSLEYNFIEKSAKNYIEVAFAERYLLQVKHHIYKNFIENNMSNPFTQSNKLEIASVIRQIVCEEAQDVYQYHAIAPFKDDLFFVKEGTIIQSLAGQHQFKIFDREIRAGQSFGHQCFALGIQLPQVTKCKNYCDIYIISRKEYKNILQSMKQKLQFMDYYNRALLSGNYSLDSESMVNFMKFIEVKNQEIIRNTLNKECRRKKQKRIKIRSVKIINRVKQRADRKSIGTQTEKYFCKIQTETVLQDCNDFHDSD